MQRRWDAPVDHDVDDHVHMREDDLARRWSISIRTLQRWRKAGKAPPHLELGSGIRYRREDIEAFEEQQLRGGSS